METADLHFPCAGLDLSRAFVKQPNQPIEDKYYRTTPVMRNLRATDSVRRLRGGMRSGHRKYVAVRAANWITQAVGSITVTGAPWPGGVTLQSSLDGRLPILWHVAAGNFYYIAPEETAWTAATNTTGNTPPLNASGLCYGTNLNQRVYLADGTNNVVFNPLDGTLATWPVTDGTIPQDSDGNRATLLETWRGRVLHAGFEKDPSLIMASKISDGTNYQYNPPLPIPPDSAWSLAIAPQGKTGDVIRGMVPYSDDLLVIGMDNAIALMRGDPTAAGQIDLVTRAIGMARGRAWTMDPQGNVYFFSNRCSVYRMDASGSQLRTPVEISQAIRSELQAIDTGENVILLQWDEKQQGMKLTVTLANQSFPATHWFWEAPSNSWSQDDFANSDHNPVCSTVFDGNRIEDRTVIYGSWDGYLRAPDHTVSTDDGEDIETEVWIGPFLTKYQDEVILGEIQGILAETSGSVDYAIFVGRTAEEALGSSPVAMGTWTAGRNGTDRVYRGGHAAYIRLTSTNRWAMETIRATIEPKGPVRRRATIGS